MAASSLEDIRRHALDEGRNLLVERVRLAVWVILGATVIFALADVRISPTHLPAMYAWKLVHAGTGVAVLAALRTRRERAVWLGLLFAAVLSLSVAAQGAIMRDVVTTATLCIVINLGAAAILPWGFLPQLVLASVAAAATAGSAYRVGGSVEAALSYPILAALSTCAVSVWLAHVLERQRLAAAGQSIQRATEAIRQSEERFALAARGANDGIWDWDLATQEVYFSPRWRELLGVDESEIAPRFAEWEQRVHPDDRERFAAEIAAHLDGILPHFENEHRLRHRNGTYRWMLARGLTIRDAAGRPTRMAGSLTDITEHKALEERLLSAMAEARRAEEAVRESEERFRQLGEHIHDILWIGNPGFTEVLYVSPAFDQIFGRPRAPVYKHPPTVMEYVHPQDRKYLADGVRRIAGGAFAEAEWRIVRPDGSIRWIWGQGLPIRNERGEVYRTVGVWRDITERKRAEEEKTALLGVAQDISGTLDLNEILDRAQRRIAEALPCDHVVTFYWDAVRQATRVAGHYGTPPDLVADVTALEFHQDDPITLHLAREGTVVINDVHAQPWLPPDQLAHFRTTALVGTPLIVRGHVLGACFAFNSTSGRRFDPPQVQLFEGIARHMALALEAAALYRTQQDDAQVSAALARVAQEMIAALDAPGLLDRLCRITTEVLGCECSHTWLWQPDEQVYVPVAGSGDAPEQWEYLRILRLFRSMMAGVVDRLEREELVDVCLAEPGELLTAPAALSLSHTGITRALFMALRRGGELVGMHVAAHRGRAEPFTPLQERIARGVAQLASVSLEHARVVEELERANTVKAHFVATMSHELRAAIAAIKSCHDVLLDEEVGALTPAQAETVRYADKYTREVQDLIRATLDLSRFEAKRVPLDLREVRVAELLDDLAHESPAPADAAVRLVWEVGADLPSLHTDPLKLKMVLRNLIGNARKFTERGRVTVRAAPHDEGVEFQVIDTGIGIPPAALATIFEPFEQAHGAESRRKGGAGLGLYLVRRLVDLLGGALAVDSAVGRGSTFRVWIPRELVDSGRRAEPQARAER